MTIKMWFDYLPADVRQKAIANMVEEELSWEVDTLERALKGAFLFEETNEGEQYWINVLNSVKEPPTPRPDLAAPCLSMGNVWTMRRIESYDIGRGDYFTNYRASNSDSFEEQYAE